MNSAADVLGGITVEDLPDSKTPIVCQMILLRRWTKFLTRRVAYAPCKRASKIRIAASCSGCSGKFTRFLCRQCFTLLTTSKMIGCQQCGKRIIYQGEL